MFSTHTNEPHPEAILRNHSQFSNTTESGLPLFTAVLTEAGLQLLSSHEYQLSTTVQLLRSSVPLFHIVLCSRVPRGMSQSLRQQLVSKKPMGICTFCVLVCVCGIISHWRRHGPSDDCVLFLAADVPTPCSEGRNQHISSNSDGNRFLLARSVDFAFTSFAIHTAVCGPAWTDCLV